MDELFAEELQQGWIREVPGKDAELRSSHKHTAVGKLGVVNPNCDNSASDAASWKGLSLAKGLCSLLRSFFLLQERQFISVHIDHVPGFKNDLADALSRAYDPTLIGFSSDQLCFVPGTAFPATLRAYTYPLELDMSRFLACA
ncbi:unnamed protein product [Symbiodinium natans]|uniref:Uncharacterized protein n=1 Tax=Symbiodinium natans TaxID=878477 RepID=A0A812KH13_9DINO|nr:unnamed protein product [Symbiodinium natans]